MTIYRLSRTPRSLITLVSKLVFSLSPHSSCYLTETETHLKWRSPVPACWLQFCQLQIFAVRDACGKKRCILSNRHSVLREKCSRVGVQNAVDAIECKAQAATQKHAARTSCRIEIRPPSSMKSKTGQFDNVSQLPNEKF